jgi:hypothetical protein
MNSSHVAPVSQRKIVVRLPLLDILLSMTRRRIRENPQLHLRKLREKTDKLKPGSVVR